MHLNYTEPLSHCLAKCEMKLQLVEKSYVTCEIIDLLVGKQKDSDLQAVGYYESENYMPRSLTEQLKMHRQASEKPQGKDWEGKKRKQTKCEPTIYRQQKRSTIPAFSMKLSHFSASFTLTIRCSGAYKFEKEIA